MSAAEKLLAVVLAALALLATGYHTGVKVTRNAQEAARARTVDKAIERHDTAAVAGNGVEKKAIRADSRQETYTRKLAEEARAYVKANPAVAVDCSLDPYRLYRWRAANRGAPVDPAGLPDGLAAGGAAAAGEPVAGGSDGEPHRGGGDVPPPAGTLPRPDRVDGDD